MHGRGRYVFERSHNQLTALVEAPHNCCSAMRFWLRQDPQLKRIPRQLVGRPQSRARAHVKTPTRLTPSSQRIEKIFLLKSGLLKSRENIRFRRCEELDDAIQRHPPIRASWIVRENIVDIRRRAPVRRITDDAILAHLFNESFVDPKEARPDRP